MGATGSKVRANLGSGSKVRAGLGSSHFLANGVAQGGGGRQVQAEAEDPPWRLRRGQGGGEDIWIPSPTDQAVSGPPG